MAKKIKSKWIKLIVNPGAGDALEEAEKINTVTSYLEENGRKVDVVLITSPKRTTRVAKRAAKKGFKVVTAMGGDGTVEAVMRGLVGSKARLGIIPAGTENNVAKSLGIPIDLQKACDLIIANKAQKADIGRIKIGNGKSFYFFEMASIGLTASIYPDVNKVTKGNLSGIKDTVLTFLQHETKPDVFLKINSESKIKINSMLVLVSNTPIFGRDFLVAPGASLQDGLLDISIYPDFSKAELLRYFAAVMGEGYSGDKKVQYYQARKLTVKTSPKLDVMADDVALGRGKVKIRVCPGILKVFTNNDGLQAKNTPENETQLPSKLQSQEVEQNHNDENVIKVS